MIERKKYSKLPKKAIIANKVQSNYYFEFFDLDFELGKP